MIELILDTNTCIAIMNNKPERVRERLLQHPVESVGLSVVSYYELQYGVRKSQRRSHNESVLDDFITYVQVCDWVPGCAIIAGDLRADLETRGQLIGPYDIMIAAHARALNATLVTRNTREFDRIAKLKVCDWEK